MLPLIRSGSVIQVEPVDVTALRLGDIIFYRSRGNRQSAHRLIRKHPVRGSMLFFTRGDSLPWRAVDRVEPGQVLGRVVAVEWRRGFKVRLDRGPGRRLSLLLAAMSPLLRWSYPSLSKLKRKLIPEPPFWEQPADPAAVK
jgi:hypothetical protein